MIRPGPSTQGEGPTMSIGKMARLLVSGAVALALQAAPAVPAPAHGLFGDGSPEDLLQDALLNFAMSARWPA